TPLADTVAAHGHRADLDRRAAALRGRARNGVRLTVAGRLLVAVPAETRPDVEDAVVVVVPARDHDRAEVVEDALALGDVPARIGRGDADLGVVVGPVPAHQVQVVVGGR